MRGERKESSVVSMLWSSRERSLNSDRSLSTEIRGFCLSIGICNSRDTSSRN